MKEKQSEILPNHVSNCIGICNYNTQIPELDFEAYSYGYFEAGFSNRLNLRKTLEGKKAGRDNI